ncbi:MAG: amidohydrolase family protein [Nitrososphaerales archaeon]
MTKIIMETPIIDVHTHAFPDDLAPKVIEALRAKYKVDSVYPCTIGSLLDVMEKTQVDVSIIQIYANSPKKVRLLNDWGSEVVKRNRPKIYCFGTIHPDMDKPSDELERIVQMGLKGVKFQPTAQCFRPDEPRLFKIYEKMVELKLPALFHAGDERKHIDPIYAPPRSFVEILSSFPDFTVILAHLGGYRMWDQIDALLDFKNVYFDTSATNSELDEFKLKRMIELLGIDRVMYGSDFPWFDWDQELKAIKKVSISEEEKKKILGGNASRILGIPDLL